MPPAGGGASSAFGSLPTAGAPGAPASPHSPQLAGVSQLLAAARELEQAQAGRRGCTVDAFIRQAQVWLGGLATAAPEELRSALLAVREAASASQAQAPPQSWQAVAQRIFKLTEMMEELSKADAAQNEAIMANIGAVRQRVAEVTAAAAAAGASKTLSFEASSPPQPARTVVVATAAPPGAAASSRLLVLDGPYIEGDTVQPPARLPSAPCPKPARLPPAPDRHHPRPPPAPARAPPAHAHAPVIPPAVCARGLRP